MSIVLATVLAVITVTLLTARPWRCNEGVAALSGAALFMLAGLVSPAQAIRVVLHDWNVFLFFLGLMTVATLTERAGLFEWLARQAADHAFGSVRIVFLYVILITTGVSILLTNDTAALILTPIVYTVVLGLRLEPLPFMFATTFVANAASLALPISNPINFLLADSFTIGLVAYAQHLWLPEVASVTVTAFLLSWIFRRELRGPIRQREDGDALVMRTIAVTGVLLGALIVSYVIASFAGFPLGLVALGGAIAMMTASHLRADLNIGSLARSTTWPIFGFLAGMLIVVRGLENAGVIGAFAHVLIQLAGPHTIGIIAVTTVGAAAGSNVVNNLPMAVTLGATLHQHLAIDSNARTAGVYAAVVGCDLGPNLTHLGSLSSMIWLLLLRRRGLEVSVGEYLRIGSILTPVALAAAGLALYVSAR